MGYFQGKNGEKLYFWVILGAKIWIKIRKPRDRFQVKLIKIRDPENLVGSRPLRGGFIFNTPVGMEGRDLYDRWDRRITSHKSVDTF